MSFAHPLVLLALILPILLAIHLWRKHTRALALPFDHQETKHAVWTSRLLNCVNTLPALILAIAIIL